MVPSWLRVAGHPLRWQLLCELGQSDRRVEELVALVGRQQNLVSYHLGRLRAGGLVTSRRSSADGRDTYYSLDLDRCRKLLAEVGERIHPSLGLASPSRQRSHKKVRVLFLCTGNSTRSQMAEALLRHYAPATVEAASAGSHPKPLHPNAIRAMGAMGLDLTASRPKSLDRFARRRFEYVVTLCDKVREVCPEFPGHPRRMHWSIADPSVSAAPDEVTYPAFQRTAEELEARVRWLVHAIDQEEMP